MRLKNLSTVHLVEEEVEAFGLEVPAEAPYGLYYSSLEGGGDKQLWFDSFEVLDTLNETDAYALVTPDYDRVWPNMSEGELGELVSALDVYEQLIAELEAGYNLDDELKDVMVNILDMWTEYLDKYKLN